MSKALTPEQQATLDYFVDHGIQANVELPLPLMTTLLCNEIKHWTDQECIDAVAKTKEANE